MKFRDLKGMRFGRLDVIEYAGYRRHGKPMWKCRCDCGNDHETYTEMLTSGQSKSCGCLNRELASERMKSVQLKTHTHNMTTTRFYKCWQGMLSRCKSENGRSFKDYGSRGIVYSENWESFDNFKSDMYGKYLEHASVHGEKNTTLERNDVHGNYSIENCKWATRSEQARNRRSNKVFEYNGKLLTLIEISEIVNIPYTTITKRLYAGWEFGDAVSRKVDVRFRSKSS